MSGFSKSKATSCLVKAPNARVVHRPSKQTKIWIEWRKLSPKREKITSREVAGKLGFSFWPVQRRFKGKSQRASDYSQNRASKLLTVLCLCLNFWLKAEQLVPQPPISPDAAPCYILTFPELKIALKGGRLIISHDSSKITESICRFKTMHFKKCYERWRERWDRCMKSQGDCFQANNIDQKVPAVMEKLQGYPESKDTKAIKIFKNIY